MNKEKIQKALELYGLKGVYPAANLMPMMSETEYVDLVKDVREHGFVHPVRVTSEGLLIDGRNRLCASIEEEVQKDVSIEVYDPVDPIQYVLSENLQRRHLTAGQKAMIATEVEKLYAEEAKKKLGGDRKSEDFKKSKVVNSPPLKSESDQSDSEKKSDSMANKSANKAGKTVGVGEKSVRQAKKLQSENPELADKVKTGELSLNKAVKQAKEQEQAKELATPEAKSEPPVLELKSEPVKVSKSKFNETNDNIEWARWTWNPVTGCKMGCPYCYARDIAIRFNGTFEPAFHEDRLDAPANTKNKPGYPNNVFVCSMADLFGNWVQKEWINKVLQAVKDNPQWNFLFLTKNPKRYLEFEFPDNCWLGATADIQSRADSAIEVFNQMNNQHIHFLSCEPLLEEINISNAKNLQWVIVGGQSKTSKCQEFQPKWQWVENLLVSAHQKDCKVFFKPNLKVLPKEYPFS